MSIEECPGGIDLSVGGLNFWEVRFEADLMKRRRGNFGTFDSLKSHNYRLYMAGQLVSVSGTWMQTVGLSWLVLKLTGSGVALGAVLAAQFLPVLILGAFGGLVADRANKRKLIVITQSSLALASLLLGTLTELGAIQMWMVYSISIWLGVTNALDNPARQSFVSEMVRKKNVANAVSLNAVVMNSARVIGPGIAGLVIYSLGIGFLFIANASSFIAVIIALLAMRVGELNMTQRASRSKGQLRDGFKYVWSMDHLKVPLLMMVLVGTMAFEFQVSFPLFASSTFHQGAGTYAAFMSFMGAGAVIGGLSAATFPQTSIKRFAITSIGFGLLILIAAIAPSPIWAMVAMVPMGAASIVFISIANSILQLKSDPMMRGRVMALFTVAFMGSTPVGAPIVGYIGQHFGARYSIAIGGVAALFAGAYGLFHASRRPAAIAETTPDAENIKPAGNGSGLVAFSSDYPCRFRTIFQFKHNS